jgi:hypothetical protein
VLILLFDLITSRSPGSSQNIPRYAELSSKKDRTEEEEKEFSVLSTQLDPILSFGETDFESNVERAVSNTLDQMLKSPSKDLDLEVKRQLRELFHNKDEWK